MSRVILILTFAVLVVSCSLALSEAKRRRENERGCNISYERDSACTTENSYPSPRRFGSGGRRPLVTTDNGRVCRCMDPNWKRCADERRNCVESSTTTAGAATTSAAVTTAAASTST